MGILFIICLLFLIVFTLICFAVIQIKLAGMNIKDFWSFIEANQMLDKLYRFSKRYEKLGNTEQIIFLQEGNTLKRTGIFVNNINGSEVEARIKSMSVAQNS